MQEENQIAEVEEIETAEPLETEELSEEEKKEKKKKRDYVLEMALFLILGILIGITIKTEAVKRITIGFNDYQLKNGTQAFNIDQMQADLEQQAQAAQAAQQNAGAEDQSPDQSQIAPSQSPSAQPSTNQQQ